MYMMHGEKKGGRRWEKQSLCFPRLNPLYYDFRFAHFLEIFRNEEGEGEGGREEKRILTKATCRQETGERFMQSGMTNSTKINLHFLLEEKTHT